MTERPEPSKVKKMTKWFENEEHDKMMVRIKLGELLAEDCKDLDFVKDEWYCKACGSPFNKSHTLGCPVPLIEEAYNALKE
jgi:hypothetical protein